VIFNASSVSTVIAANTTPTSSPVMLAYTYLTWAPNGQALLIGFNLYFSTESGQSSAGVNGLLLLGLSHASPTHVWIDKIQSLQVGTVERWDLASGASTLVPEPPVATAYHWNSDGTLAPATGASDGPIGMPDGGHAFSVWQSGSLGHPTYQPGPNTAPVTRAQDIGWAANLLPVSPDGHYFYSYFPSGFSLVPPSTKTIVPGEATHAPRDKALLTLAQAMTNATNPSQSPETWVTWRIDGQRLAAITLNGAGAGDASPSAFTVSIYDTASGNLLKRLTPSFNGLQSGSAGAETLQWSPDGSRLLLADNAYGSITIWGPGALPA
jgi:WD40 repeat protein